MMTGIVRERKGRAGSWRGRIEDAQGMLGTAKHVATPTFIAVTRRQTISGLPLLFIGLLHIIIPLRLLGRLVYMVFPLGRDFAHGLVAKVDPPVDDLLQPVQLCDDPVDALRVWYGHGRVDQIVQHDLLELLDSQGKILGVDVFYRRQAGPRGHRAGGRVATALAHGARAGLLASALEARGWRHLE